MTNRDSLKNTFRIAAILCLVCSVIVSAAAVLLRDRQNANKEREKKKNILIAAGLYDEQERSIVVDGKLRDDLTVEAMFKQSSERPWIEEKIISLDSGEKIGSDVETMIENKFVKLDRYDQRKASRDPGEDWSRQVPAAGDVAGIKRREKFAPVYFVHSQTGELDQIVLPIRGYGLWSTLWGFISLDADLVTIRGLTFYEHGETPGLGGEVDNLAWKASWKKKQAFGANGKVQIRVIKGKVRAADKEAVHKIDGLSGATITSRGVTNMMHYWLGKDGFGPLLDRLRRKD